MADKTLTDDAGADPVGGKMTISIRDMPPTCEAEWRRLWAGYLRFYGAQVPAPVTDAAWARLHSPASALRGRAAFDGDRMVGFSISLLHESTWSEAPSCYLEDLFVHEDSRGTGVGAALIRDLIELAVRQGCSRLYWHTDQDNVAARRLYDRFTAASGVVRYRIEFRSGKATSGSGTPANVLSDERSAHEPRKPCHRCRARYP